MSRQLFVYVLKCVIELLSFDWLSGNHVLSYFEIKLIFIKTMMI